MLEDRLDLGSPHDARVGDAVIERFDTKSVADQHQSLTLGVVDDDGEFTPKLMHKVQTVANVKGQRNGTVALAVARHRFTGQFRSNAFETVELPVDRCCVVATVSFNRLMAAVQSNDRKTRVAKCQTLVKIKSTAALIRPAVV